LGPGHLGAILAIDTAQARDEDYYRGLLSRFRPLSHVTIEVRRRSSAIVFVRAFCAELKRESPSLSARDGEGSFL
jgi:hypothetical protein